MFNDISSLCSHLATRRSGKARDMVAPGPDAATLRDIIALALRTPDHGKLVPWRIVTIADGQREALAALLKRAWVAEHPGAAGMDLSLLDQFAQQVQAAHVLISPPPRASTKQAGATTREEGRVGEGSVCDSTIS